MSKKRDSLASKRRFVRSLTRYSIYTGDEPQDEGIHDDHELLKDEKIPSSNDERWDESSNDESLSSPRHQKNDKRSPQPSEKRVALDVHIQLVLPATDDASKYDQIFAALKRHLLS